jgi:DNA polymerase I-like protein with 3'-5' exonuclease and polymerase domains
VAKTLLQYAQTNKLLTGFVEAWLGNEEEGKESKIYDGCLYTHFKQYGAVSGRLSSAAPNVNNIPRADTPDGKLIRGAVLAPEGWLLAVADWNQIESVVLAHFIGKGKLYDGFLAGIDPHLVQAASALGKRVEDVTSVERQDMGKTLGFAIGYGAGLGRIASMMKVSERRAKVVLAKHEQEMPEVYAFKDHVIQVAANRKPPHIRTLLGRKRRVSMLNSPNRGQRAAAERQLFNSLIQGSAADLMKLALIYADDMLARELPDAYLSITCHDEMVGLAPAEQAADALAIITEAMTGPHIQKLLRVPLKVSGAVCSRWSQAKG